MKASLALSLLTFGLATNARRFIHRSEPIPPPACIATQKSSTVDSSFIPPVVTTPASVSSSATASTSVAPIVSTNSSSILSSSVLLNDTAIPTATFVGNSSTLLVPPAAPTGGYSEAINTTLTKRIAQPDLPSLALLWQDLCLASGGDIFTFDSPCVSLAGFRGIDALLANADPCDQQDVADDMITFAKSVGVTNTKDLVAFAVAYRQHPRNAINILGIIPSTPYCLRPPVHEELIGLVNGQLEGVEPGLYGGPNYPIVPFGAEGSCPFGTTPDIATCSCVADNSTSVDLPPTLPTSNGTDTSVVTASSTDTVTDIPPESTAVEGTDIDTAVNETDSTVSVFATATSAATAGAATDVVSSTDAEISSTDEGTTAIASSTVDVGGAAATTVASPPATTSIEGFSGDINDPNGRR